MKEVTFLNRVPTYPGRVKLTPVAGQADTYDMERADSPVVEGTPLDKATFESVVHSRLTGRYYAPTVARVVNTARTGLTTSPIPTSGWVYAGYETNTATSGSYRVRTSGSTGTNRGHDAFTSTGWEAGEHKTAWVEIYHEQPVKVYKINLNVAAMRYSYYLQSFKIEASNDGAAWVTKAEFTSVTTGSAQEYTLNDPGEYNYYRLYFVSSEYNTLTVKNLRYSLYDITTYASAFTVASGFPATWDIEQRVLLLTPSSINSFGVITNTLNGVTVSTILQPNKRYELRYTGSSFVAKEV